MNGKEFQKPINFCVWNKKENKKIIQNKILFGTINIYLYRFIILYGGIFIYFTSYFFFSWFSLNFILFMVLCSFSLWNRTSSNQKSKTKSKHVSWSEKYLIISIHTHTHTFHVNVIIHGIISYINCKIKIAFRLHLEK